MSKRLTKTIWYGSGVDSNGNPILPSNNGGLDGLNYGELYLHLSNGKASLWTLSSDGKIVEITGGGSEVDMSSYLLKSIWDKVFEIRTDSQGTEYIFGKLPVVTQYGITMYSGDGVDIPSLASGLPFDGRTIWYNPDTQQIEVIGGTGGGSGEGVSNFWDLSGIPSWITNTKPKYSYSEIEGTPDLTQYALVSQIPSLSGYATESWVTKQNYATKATTLSGYGITDAYTKTNVDDLLQSYVTLGGTQTITGEKNFTGGLKVNGSPIYYDSTKKYWKLEGDLLVTGGVTMYGSDSSFTPSTIMDAILYDSATLGINSNGQLYVKGGTSGGGLDITALQNYLTQNSYLNVTSGDNRYLKLSGGTLASSSVPLYIDRTDSNSYVLIGYKIASKDFGYLGFSNYGDLVVSPNRQNGNLNYYAVWHEGNFNPSNYLPLSGGTMTGNILLGGTTTNKIGTNIVDTTSGWQEFTHQNSHGYIAIGPFNGSVAHIYTDRPSFYFNKDLYVNNAKVWHAGNDGSGSGLEADYIGSYKKDSGEKNLIYGTRSDNTNLRRIYDNGWNLMCQNGSDNGVIATLSSNVASATKLQTARTIWGQSFDGTENVSGNITGRYFSIRDSSSNPYIKLTESSLYSGYVQILPDGSMAIGPTSTLSLIVSQSGNVGIGATNPTQKLHIEGNVYATGYVNPNYIILESTNSRSANSGGFRMGRFDEPLGGIKLQFGGDGTGNFSIINREWNAAALTLNNSGNLSVSGGITMYSDQRKKTILNHVELSLKQIAEAPLIEHYYNSDDKKTTHVGSIAQYWASMNDWFCKLDSEGFYTMEIQNAALASAISIARELDRYETKTDKAIKKLKKRICELEEEVERLKSA